PANTSVAVEVIARRSPPATRRTVTTATAPSSYLERLCGCSGTDDGAVAGAPTSRDRKSTRLNSSHVEISYAVFCLKKKKNKKTNVKKKNTCISYETLKRKMMNLKPPHTLSEYH